MEPERIRDLRQIAYLDPDPLLTECLDHITQLRHALDIAYMEMGTEARKQTIGPNTTVTVREVILAAMRGEEHPAQQGADA